MDGWMDGWMGGWFGGWVNGQNELGNREWMDESIQSMIDDWKDGFSEEIR